jgi:hypothetical protein
MNLLSADSVGIDIHNLRNNQLKRLVRLLNKKTSRCYQEEFFTQKENLFFSAISFFSRRSGIINRCR